MKSFALLFALLCTFCLQSTAQCIYNPSPTTKAALDATNCALARRYAPVLFQYVNASPDEPSGNWRDTPVPVNYDGDWNHFNNWENAPSVLWRVPSAYYHVFWTAELYIITYSYYYPRDWSPDNFWCHANTSRHEGDLERAIVYVDRAMNTIRGWSVSNHGNLDHYFPNVITSCISDRIFPAGANSDYYPGQHPMIYGSSGSHALYLNSEDAEDDDKTEAADACKPEPEFVMAYVPGGTFAFTEDFPVPFNGLNWGLEGNDPLYSNTYRLIDVFGPSPDGDNASLWSQRDNNNSNTGLMTEGQCKSGGIYNMYTKCDWTDDDFWENPFTDYSNQRLYCDDHCGNFWGSDKPVAALPWNGKPGLHIQQVLGQNFQFGCCLNDILSGCTSLTVNTTDELQYTYNEYLCPSYSIKMTSRVEFFGLTVVTLEYSSMGYKCSTPVQWYINNSTNFTCIGCDQNQNEVTVLFQGQLDPDNSDFTVWTASQRLECGYISDYWALPVAELMEDNQDQLANANGDGTTTNGDNSGDANLEILASLKLSPNPTTDYIQLKIEDLSEGLGTAEQGVSADDFIGGDYFILTIDGQLLTSSTLTSKLMTLNISTLAKGQYILYVQANNNAVLSNKFIIQ